MNNSLAEIEESCRRALRSPILVCATASMRSGHLAADLDSPALDEQEKRELLRSGRLPCATRSTGSGCPRIICSRLSRLARAQRASAASHGWGSPLACSRGGGAPLPPSRESGGRGHHSP